MPRLGKKAKVMGTIMQLLLLIIAGMIIIEIWGVFTSKAEGATAEQLCRSFNAARTKGEVEIKRYELFNIVPRTCKKLYKNIPEEGEMSVDNTMSEIADLSARCWWMWLEGLEDGSLGEKWHPYANNNCFICYSFNIKPDIEPFDGQRFIEFFDKKVYDVEDSSDGCNINGGGWCMGEDEPCDGKKLKSSKCGEDKVCCNKKIECENKGGDCLEQCGPDYQSYEGWSCGEKGGQCCIEDDNFLSYTKYIQSYRGEGAHVVAVKRFEPLERTYAITFVAKTASWENVRNLFDSDPFSENHQKNTILISTLNEVYDYCTPIKDTGGS